MVNMILLNVRIEKKDNTNLYHRIIAESQNDLLSQINTSIEQKQPLIIQDDGENVSRIPYEVLQTSIIDIREMNIREMNASG